MAELDEQTERLLRITLDDFQSLGVLADGGRLYLPTEIRRRNEKGGVDVVDKALLTIPDIRQKTRARVESRAYGVKELKLDLERDADLFRDLESYALLGFALRDVKTKGQLQPTLAELINTYTDAALAEVYGRLNQWTELNDPRFGELSSEKLWQVIAGLARGNPFPLQHMPTYGQSTCFALMAREALLSPNAPSWARLPETSPSDASTKTSSDDALAVASPADPSAEA